MGIFIILTLILLGMAISFGIGFGIYKLIKYLVGKNDREKEKEK